MVHIVLWNHFLQFVGKLYSSIEIGHIFFNNIPIKRSTAVGIIYCLIHFFIFLNS